LEAGGLGARRRQTQALLKDDGRQNLAAGGGEKVCCANTFAMPNSAQELWDQLALIARADTGRQP
jgi:hypothetical protein